ncbi:MAG: hypothetical protein IPP74_09275 [Alphaproteobacteria bacterium]|nr:hypothetical protein [Alphaproteobacteria bacterium]
MNKSDIIKSHVDICDKHAKRLSFALEQIQHLIPFNENTIESATLNEVNYIEIMTNRFEKLSTTIGEKIFPALLELMQEDIKGLSMIDRLNKLEKLYVIESVEWWKNIRETRNSVAHDYPDHSVEMANALNSCAIMSKELLSFWQKLRGRLLPFLG